MILTSSEQPPRPFLASLIDMEMIPVPIAGRALYFSRYEVTQAQWQKLMGFNPSRHQGRDLPVTNVSLDDIREFLNRLNAAERDRPVTYRLPSIEEWKAAASIGFNRDAQSWHSGNSLGKPQPVGGKSPNGFGLHDMTGNVWEWCADGFVCGGAYDSSPDDATPETVHPAPGRRPLPSNSRIDNVGFRVVASFTEKR
ncbi:MAG: formylglycine-generating enzyme family protein [Chloracidobacterium sp.]|nr:formylglycine-generating enzyme family protein [Chloracidobacterium sp.]